MHQMMVGAFVGCNGVLGRTRESRSLGSQIGVQRGASSSFGPAAFSTTARAVASCESATASTLARARTTRSVRYADRLYPRIASIESLAS